MNARPSHVISRQVRTPPLDERPWYTLDEAAGLLGMSLKSAYNKIHLEEFPVPHFKLGRRVAVMKNVVDAYFDQLSRNGINELHSRISML